MLPWGHWRELTERNRKKRQKVSRKRTYSSYVKIYANIYTCSCLPFQSMYKCNKEVFLFMSNASNLYLYLYPGLIVAFYFAHEYLENKHNRPFLLHLNWCLFEFSCFCSLGFMLRSLIFNLKWGRGTLANCSYTSPRKIPPSSVNRI